MGIFKKNIEIWPAIGQKHGEYDEKKHTSQKKPYLSYTFTSFLLSPVHL